MSSVRHEGSLSVNTLSPYDALREERLCRGLGEWAVDSSDPKNLWMEQEACAEEQEDAGGADGAEAEETCWFSESQESFSVRLHSYLVLTGSAVCVVVAGNVL